MYPIFSKKKLYYFVFQVLLQYILNYPLGKKVNRYLDFFIANLRYCILCQLTCIIHVYIIYIIIIIIIINMIYGIIHSLYQL